MAKFKSVIFYVTLASYETDDFMRFPTGARVEIEFENAADCLEFLEQAKIPGCHFVYKNDLVVQAELPLSQPHNDLSQVEQKKVIDGLKAQYPEAFKYDGPVEEYDEIIVIEDKNNIINNFDNIIDNVDLPPAPPPAPPPSPLPSQQQQQQQQQQQAEPLNLGAKFKKHLSNFLKDHPEINRLAFNIQLFIKMPTRYPAALGVFNFLLALGAGSYFLSLSWTVLIPCAITYGLGISASTIYRNNKYEQAAKDISKNTKEQNQAYKEGREAGEWKPYFNTYCDKDIMSHWAKDPLHFGAGLNDALDEIEKKERKAFML